MVGNGFGDHAVGHDGLVDEFFVGDVHEHHHRCVDDRDQLPHYQILAALGDAGVKGDVVLDVAVALVNLGLHPLAEPPQSLDILRGGVLRRHLRNARLQQQTDVHQIKGQRVLVLHTAQVQRVGKPLDRGHHIGAGALPHLHDALAGQQLDRFADGAAPHPELFAQRKLVGQLCARLQRLIQNIMVDLVLHLLGQQLVFQM